MTKRTKVAKYRFRGSVIAFRWNKGLGVDRVEADAQILEFHGLFRKTVVVARSDTAAVRFRPIRFPLFFSTEVTVEVTDGTRVRKMFVPMRTQRMKSKLADLGWPVHDLPTVGFSALWTSPYA